MAPTRGSTNADPEKQLTIKTKACQRLVKEAAYYEREVQENEGKLEKMKSEGRDKYDIKKFEEVLGESRMMVPDSRSRMKNSLEDLSLFLDGNSEALDAASEMMSTARALLAEHNVGAGERGVPETNVDDLKEGEAF